MNFNYVLGFFIIGFIIVIVWFCAYHLINMLAKAVVRAKGGDATGYSWYREFVQWGLHNPAKALAFGIFGAFACVFMLSIIAGYLNDQEVAINSNLHKTHPCFALDLSGHPRVVPDWCEGDYDMSDLQGTQDLIGGLIAS